MKPPKMMAMRVTPKTYDIAFAINPSGLKRVPPHKTCFLVINYVDTIWIGSNNGRYGSWVPTIEHRYFEDCVFEKAFVFIGEEQENTLTPVREKKPPKPKYTDKPHTFAGPAMRIKHGGQII